MGKKGRKKAYIAIALFFFAAIFSVISYHTVRGVAFPRPFKSVVEESRLDSSLIYSVIKAESGFKEDAKSSAGAVGMMQLMPSTAEFVCRMNDIEYVPERLTEGEYNIKLGCLYLEYLFKRFDSEKTVLAAYNAGEGTVSEWLKESAYSPDEKHLEVIPYPETERYVKKIEKFSKIYQFFYH